MDAELVRLASDSGELLAVNGIMAPSGRYSALQFEFASGVLKLRCDDDTDEVIVEVGEEVVGGTSVPGEEMAELIGMRIESAWRLINQRGYVDAFQLRLTDGDDEKTRQFEVAASAIDVWRVVA